MSGFWSGFIIVLTVVNVLGCVWLLMRTAKRKPGERAEDTTGHVWDDDLTEYNKPLPRWWLWLFYLTIIFGVVYLALYPGMGSFAGTLGWSQEQVHADEMAAAEAKYGPIYKAHAAKPIPELAKDDAAMATAQRLFANTCAGCHASDGRGSPGYPNLADNEWLYGGDPETIKASILHGRSGVMPAWGGALGEIGVEEMAAYVYVLSGRAKPDFMSRAGEARYAGMCAGCHGVEGKGNPALGAPDLTDRVWLYGGSLEAIKTSIRNGRNGEMPAHKDILGEDRVHLVAAYVYRLSQQEAGNGGR